MKKNEVVAAIIMYQDQILCMQRDKGKYEYISYKYEFPGGKVEPGESNAQALQRELREEMALEVDIKDEDYYMSVEHEYPDFKITMHSFICKVDSQEFTRKEHIDHKWLTRKELMTLDWAAADVPIVHKLQEDGDELN
ncbi:MAG: (deoxy)nucleoside triphosphate pyrophosphohydrolase [Cellulosilyticum sp.]|nr:(deoxy)nucleoside triphosphate pyrophosphohydrolase [Cellulosilyticum sp.]